MRKFIVLLAALAVAVAVQTPQRAIAQTAPASKDANETISLTAQQKKQTAAPVRAAPARTVARPSAPTRSVAQPNRPTRSVAQPNRPTRTVTQPRWEGKVMTGADYFLEHVQPNFFFHVSHCYAILRHNGVPIGKKDYLGQLTQRMP